MLPSTSLEAYHSLEPDSVETLHRKILEGLKAIGKGTSQQVSDYIGIPHERIWKRFSELERDEKIYNTKIKHKNKSGRNAYQYAIRNSDTIVPPPEKYVPSDITASDYAALIIAGTKQQKLVQKSIFEDL